MLQQQNQVKKRGMCVCVRVVSTPPQRYMTQKDVRKKGSRERRTQKQEADEKRSIRVHRGNVFPETAVTINIHTKLRDTQ